MVANIRCGEILNDQLRALQEDQAWTSLVESAQQHLVPTFGSQASDLLESCRSGMLRTALSQGKTCFFAVIHQSAPCFVSLSHT